MTAVDVVRRYLDRMWSGDIEGGTECYAEDLVVHVPGRSSLAGELHGRRAMRAYIEKARALSHDGKVEGELVDTLSSDERVALIVRETFHTDDGPVVVNRANVYRVRGEEIAEIWIFEGNQYEVDALLGGP